MYPSKITNKIKLISVLLALASLLVTACYKPPTFPIEPQITFEGYDITGVYVPGAAGNLLVGFTDGDGDLGKTSNGDTVNVKNVLIKNLKYPFLVDSLNLPLIPKKGTADAISGRIEIKLKSLIDESDCLLLQKPTDTLRYEIRIMDRAGHISNTITTSDVIVQCP
jgi:hypothetical protein